MSDISGAFDLLDVGESGQVELLSKRDNIRGDLHSARQLIFNSTTPVGVLPKRSTQEIYDYIEKQYLHPKPAFPRSWLEQCQE
ncbi:hypothetical protein EV182_000469 [Spiromyces aspiralis]|uniref:Uncharacterized protein n=1 Tax=Spiromyces aspiralis TaxID=68401 RepID=A0ACC1HPG0_9FUNG|nr:hypothetical protein EV182_000469 [Spiromyces aspiralis]